MLRAANRTVTVCAAPPHGGVTLKLSAGPKRALATSSGALRPVALPGAASIQGRLNAGQVVMPKRGPLIWPVEPLRDA